jgi:hypothetical protein
MVVYFFVDLQTSMVGAGGRGRKLTVFSEEDRLGWAVAALLLFCHQIRIRIRIRIFIYHPCATQH